MKWNSTPSHDATNAKEAARLSALAYLDPDADICFRDTATDTEAFGWRSKDQIVIAFRGTSSKQDALIDIKFHKVPFTVAEDDTGAFSMTDLKRKELGYVHRGFLMAVGSVWRTVRKWMSIHYTGQPIFLTGHSLGAANATVMAMRLTHAGFPVTAVYTFGCPRVGDSSFARLFNEVIRHYRYVNHNDIVTRMPPWILFARHTGFEYYFNRHGERVVIGPIRKFWDRLAGRFTQSIVDGANDHKMTSYIANMK